MDSIKEIYTIGRGPSSSHSLGPAKAAGHFKAKNLNAESYEVELYGSLALTGKGHLTDQVIKEVLGDSTHIIFNYDVNYAYHPNGMCFRAFQNGSLIDEWLVFSVGGGVLKELNEDRKKSEQVYPHHLMEDILAYCKEKNWTLIDYINAYEPNDLDEYLGEVLDAMELATLRGVNQEGVLPGRLQVKRKAKIFYEKYQTSKELLTLLYAYALANSEENASGGTVVTAPTCGSCGVIPSLLFASQHHYKLERSILINGLKIAGLIGNLIKFNASISGAEVGCQGEVGAACSMGAGMIAYLKGANNETIEYAAEIALEHHLGMTCDPVDGVVQIPCIERNALSAQYAMNAADYAIMTGGGHHITLDSVIEVMDQTGRDMHEKYRETSLGGLAYVNRKKTDNGKKL